MLNVSNITHTALLGEIINTCHISIQLVKLFCKFVDLMLTSCNAIVRHFIRRAINSAQSPIGRNIAVIRHRYAICVVDINVKHVHRQYPSSQPELSETARCILELLCVSNNETCLPGFTKSVKLILWLTHFALVNQLDHFFFLYLYCYFCIQLYLHCCTNKWYTHTLVIVRISCQNLFGLLQASLFARDSLRRTLSLFLTVRRAYLNRYLVWSIRSIIQLIIIV